MKLNFNKCTFKVFSSKFLDFIVNGRCIKVNSYKINSARDESFLNYEGSTMIVWKVSYFERFVSKATDRCLPFFQILR